MAVNRKMPRIQAVVLPILREGLAEDWPGVDVGSWLNPVDKRTFPILNIRRLGGLDNALRPDQLKLPVIEMTAFSKKLVETENLYMDAEQVLIDAVRDQTVVAGVGYLHSFFTTMGMTQFDSPIEGVWRSQGLIQLGLRPVRQGDA